MEGRARKERPNIHTCMATPRIKLGSDRMAAPLGTFVLWAKNPAKEGLWWPAASSGPEYPGATQHLIKRFNRRANHQVIHNNLFYWHLLITRTAAYCRLPWLTARWWRKYNKHSLALQPVSSISVRFVRPHATETAVPPMPSLFSPLTCAGEASPH